MNVIEGSVSASSLFVSGAIGLGVWALKSSITKLVSTLWQTMAKVDNLNEKMKDLAEVPAKVNKLNSDMNVAFGKIRALEQKDPPPPSP